jgi:hypothetical protein
LEGKDNLEAGVDVSTHNLAAQETGIPST